MTVHERIRALRNEKGMTQLQLADKCGMADSAIRRYELGFATPKHGTLKRIADGLGVSVAELVGMEDGGVEPSEAEIQTCLIKDRTQAFVKREAEEKIRHDNLLEMKAVFGMLSLQGQAVAIERIRELAELPKYRR